MRCLVEKNQNVADHLVLVANRPISLRQRLEWDLEYAFHELKKDFSGAMNHYIKLTDAF